jgi:hypothetical protein
MTTLYVVSDNLGKESDRLVEASNQAQALRHVAQRYTARVPTLIEAMQLRDAGVKVEIAKPAQVPMAGVAT